MTLTIRTDKPEAEIGLFEDQKQLAYRSWQAHRELGTTIHVTIKELMQEAGKDWPDLSGIIYYKGPGSFTGLRIGAAVANAAAVTAGVPLASQNGQDWIKKGLKALADGRNEPAIPEYGSDPHTTIPRK